MDIGRHFSRNLAPEFGWWDWEFCQTAGKLKQVLIHGRKPRFLHCFPIVCMKGGSFRRCIQPGVAYSKVMDGACIAKNYVCSCTIFINDTLSKISRVHDTYI